jgi:hypothetical protein
VIVRSIRLARQLVQHGTPLARPAERHDAPPIAPEPTTQVATDARRIVPAHTAVIDQLALIDQRAATRAGNGAPAGRRIVVTGNCTANGLTAALQIIFPRDSVERYHLWEDDGASIASALVDADAWIAYPSPKNHDLLERSGTRAAQIVCPPVIFSGFHPDMVYAWRDGSVFRGAAGDGHSAIGLWAWRRGLDVPDAVRLFSPETFRRLGYYAAYKAEIEPLRDAFTRSGLDFSFFWRRVKRMGVFMHTINHPRIDVLVLLAKLLALELGMPPELLQQPLERYVPDELLPIAVWPVYPDLAVHLGVSGSYLFSFSRFAHSLEEFLEMQWEAYGDIDPSSVTCPRITDGLYDQALEPLLKDAR